MTPRDYRARFPVITAHMSDAQIRYILEGRGPEPDRYYFDLVAPYCPVQICWADSRLIGGYVRMISN